MSNSPSRSTIPASGSLQAGPDRSRIRSGKVVPTAGVLVSNTFANDTLGVLADFIYTRRDTTSNRVSVQGWEGGFYAPCQLAGSTEANCAPDHECDCPGIAASDDHGLVPAAIYCRAGQDEGRTL